MADCGLNRIYMLEFMVDKITLGYCAREPLVDLKGQMCISFKFLEHGPFNICEEDFKPKRRNYMELCPNPCYKNGKSCVFTLSDERAIQLVEYFSLELEVFKKMCMSIVPDRKAVGNLSIRIDSMFKELREDMAENKEEPLHSKVHQDRFPIYDACNNNIIGEIVAFIRITCFGKMVANDFQMDMDSKELGMKEKGGYYFQFHREDM